MESLKHIHQLCVEQLFVFWSFTWFLLGTLCDTKVKGPDRQKSEIWKFWKCESDRLTDKNQRIENFENMSLTDWQTNNRDLKFLKTWVWQTDRQKSQTWNFWKHEWQTDRQKSENWNFWKHESDRLTVIRDLEILKIWVWQTDRQKSEIWNFWKYESDRRQKKMGEMKFFKQ